MRKILSFLTIIFIVEVTRVL